jgi:hypothetical protein
MVIIIRIPANIERGTLREGLVLSSEKYTTEFQPA